MYYFQASVRVPADTGADPGFFLGEGCTRLLLYFNTNKPHSFFFSRNTSCIRKSQVISGGGAHPLHPPPRSIHETSILSHCHIFHQIIGFSGENLTYHIVQHNLWHVSLPPRCETWKCWTTSTNGNAIIVLSSKIVPSSMEIVMTSILSEIPVQRLISVFLSFRLQNISFYMRL